MVKENQNRLFTEASAWQVQSWLTIPYRETWKKSNKNARTIYVRWRREIIRKIIKQINPFSACRYIEG